MSKTSTHESNHSHLKTSLRRPDHHALQLSQVNLFPFLSFKGGRWLAMQFYFPRRQIAATSVIWRKVTAPFVTSWIEKEPLILRRHSKIRSSLDWRSRFKWNQRAAYRSFPRERARSMIAKFKLKTLRDVVPDRVVPMERLRSLTPQIASILK